MLFNANYTINVGSVCKWLNFKSFTFALHNDHYTEVIVESINHLDEIQREYNDIESHEQNQLTLYSQAINQPINEFLLFSPLSPTINRVPSIHFDKLIRANNKYINKSIDDHQDIIDKRTDGYDAINYPHEFNADVS